MLIKIIIIIIMKIVGLIIVITGDNVYGAIMTQVISRVHQVRLVNVGQRQADANPQTNRLGL